MNKNKNQDAAKDAAPQATQPKVTNQPTVNQANNSMFVFGKRNYMFFGIGFGLIVLGLLLMSGGSMPSPDVWDEDIIYSARRITLAPIVILAGLGVQIYGVFTHK